ncbi:AAA family ATPase [Ekhidna sp.]
MQYFKKHIITGGPGTGKTTLINELEKDYSCIHEVSRKVIKNEQNSGGNGTPWQDLGRFTMLVYEESVGELQANPEAIFTDRCVLDLIAYHKVVDKPTPFFLNSFPYHERYQGKVIFAPMWRAIYHKDDQRLQEFDYCVELEKALIDTYTEKGFEINFLPKDTVPIRVNFVKSLVN